MKRHEALALANQLLSDPAFGYYAGGAERHFWSKSALSAVIDLVQGTLAPDGTERPDSFRKSLDRVPLLADAGFDRGLARQVRAICETLLASEGTPPRLRRPELRQITQATELLLLLSYLWRLWTVRREQAAAPAPAPAVAERSTLGLPTRPEPGSKPGPVGLPTKPAQRLEEKSVERSPDPRWAALAKWNSQPDAPAKKGG